MPVDYGNDPEWYIDRNGGKYARKPVPDDRHPLLGPGIGHERTDRFFDWIGTAIIAVVAVVATVGLLRTLPDGQQPAPVKPSKITEKVCELP
jgi:hypothetical protein